MISTMITHLKTVRKKKSFLLLLTNDKMHLKWKERKRTYFISLVLSVCIRI